MRRATVCSFAVFCIAAVVLIFMWINSDSRSITYVDKRDEKDVLGSVKRAKPTLATLNRDIINRDLLYASRNISSSVGDYKRGRDVMYESLYRCRKPDFLPGYKSPCWRRNGGQGSIVCAGRVMLLGFHKCGTTDLSKWFAYSPEGYSTCNVDYFVEELHNAKSSVEICPSEYIEASNHRYNKMPGVETTVYIDCPGCSIINKVVAVNDQLIVLRSSMQYSQQFMRDNSRYIITMRNPTDRMLSYFFYVFKTKALRDYPLFANKQKPEEVGFQILHDLVVDSITTLTQCLRERGISECILNPKLAQKMHKDPTITAMIARSCYSVFIMEILKFIPQKRIYFSMMEEYSVDPERVVREIYTFIDDGDKSIDQNLINKKLNTGVKSKPVLPETIKLLDAFYEPFNAELVKLLGNDKWKFERTIT